MTLRQIVTAAVLGGALGVLTSSPELLVDLIQSLRRFLASESAANWASAAASTLAVIAALYIASVEHRRALGADVKRRREIEQDAAKVGAIAIAMVASELESLKSGIAKGHWTQEYGTSSKMSLERHLARLDAIPLASLPTIDMARNVVLTITAAEGALSAINLAIDQAKEETDVPRHLVDNSISKVEHNLAAYQARMRAMKIPWKD